MFDLELLQTKSKYNPIKSWSCGKIYGSHVGCLMRSRNCLHFTSTSIHPWFLVGFVLLISFVLCVSLLFIFVFVLCLVWPMLPMFLFCPVSIVSSVFSYVYLLLSSSNIVNRFSCLLFNICASQLYRYWNYYRYSDNNVLQFITSIL